MPAYQPDAEVLSKQYWQRPNDKIRGDASADDIYHAVGKALTTWEQVEETMEGLFLDITETSRSSSNPVRRAFGAVESSATRRKMILAAAAAYFGTLWDDKIVRQAFFRVIEAVGFASQRRDDIAHGTVQSLQMDRKDFGFFLLPAAYNTERTKGWVYSDPDDPLYFTFTHFRYTSEDVGEIANRFKRLNRSVAYLIGHIRKLDDGSIWFVNALLDK